MVRTIWKQMGTWSGTVPQSARLKGGIVLVILLSGTLWWTVHCGTGGGEWATHRINATRFELPKGIKRYLSVLRQCLRP